MRLTRLAVVLAGCVGFSACSDSTAVSPLAPPGDLRFAKMSGGGIPWNLDRIDSHALVFGNSYVPPSTGLGVHAYIVDTGIKLTQSDFNGRIGNGTNTIDSTGPDDCHGHGTGVAGFLGGTNYGVAKKVWLHPVKVFDCMGNSTYPAVAAGLRWIAANAIRPCIVNASVQLYPDDSVDAAIEEVIAAGCQVVAAAGNTNSDACVNSLGHIPSVLTVSGTDWNDTREYSSSWGVCVDIFAPGSSMYTDAITGTQLVGGTSSAAPHVAGAIALFLQRHPTALPQEATDSIMAMATKDGITDPRGAGNALLYTGCKTRCT